MSKLNRKKPKAVNKLFIAHCRDLNRYGQGVLVIDDKIGIEPDFAKDTDAVVGSNAAQGVNAIAAASVAQDTDTVVAPSSVQSVNTVAATSVDQDADTVVAQSSVQSVNTVAAASVAQGAATVVSSSAVQGVASDVVPYLINLKCQIPNAANRKPPYKIKQEKVVFCDNCLPGETMQIEITEEKHNYAIGKLVKILRQSDNRVEPSCKHFLTCGGCQLLHLKYQNTLAWKQQFVRDSIARIGKVIYPYRFEKIEGADLSQAQFRSKVSYPASVQNGKITFGFYRRQSHDFVRISDCLTEPPGACLLRQKLSDVLQRSGLFLEHIKHMTLRTDDKAGKFMLILTVSEYKKSELPIYRKLAAALSDDICSLYLSICNKSCNVILTDEMVWISGEKKLAKVLGNCDYTVAPNAFFQINKAQTVLLYDKISEICKKITEKFEIKRLFDLYCGAGSIGIYVAHKLAASTRLELVGIESNAAAIADAKLNAARNNIANYHYLSGKTEDLFADYQRDRDNKKSIAIFDPPRKGCDRSFIAQINNSGLPFLLYVSCDPTTLARDISLLSPFYRLEYLKPFDLFPGTTHVETVVLLSRK